MRTVLTALMFLATPALATAETVNIPTPCETDTGFHAFDFWLGDWNVTDKATGKIAGRNVIAREEGGCALIESWRGADNASGLSLSWFNPDTGLWKQVWVSVAGNSIEIEGKPERAGTMRLSGTLHEYGAGAAPFRGAWTQNPDGSVRQFFERQNKAGAWEPWFDGLYTKRP